jgi:predicted dehydrogenase
MKAAVIGMGPHGRRVADVLRSLPGVELTAVVDRSEQALGRADLPPEVARYRSDQELWSRGDVALVCVATNGPSHAALSLAAMEAGARYLLVEKPMACSLAECDQMLAKARATQTRMAVDHTRRHAPGFQWLRGKIASGDWGQLRAIWIQRPGIGLACNGTHSFDAVAYLAGTAIEHVTAWIDPPIGKNPRGEQFTDPGGLVVMELGGGIRAIVAQIEDGAGPVAVEIDMTAARIRMDEQNGAIEIVERDLSVKPGPGRPPAFHRPEPPTGLSARTDMAPLIRSGLVELISERPLATDAMHGRKAVEVLVAAYLSHRRGNVRVALPLEAREDLELWLPVT